MINRGMIAAAFVAGLAASTHCAAEGTSGALLPPTPNVVAPAAPPANDAKPQIHKTRAQPASLPKERRPVATAVRRAPPAVVKAFPPPAGETRFVRDEILVEFAPNVAPSAIEVVLRRHRLAELEAVPIALLGTSLHRWRIPDAREAGNVVRELGAEPLVASVQPNYVYGLQQNAGAAAPPPAADAGAPQYALGKLHVDAARALATGDKVLVAVVDTAIDETHPDLAGVVEARFDAVGGQAAALGHGTSIAGAIAAHGRIQGVAPQVRILAVRAFAATEAGPQGTTLAILKGIDWAAQAHARIVNMSFAGPQDPAMHRILAAAFDKGIVLVAAAGNAGRNSAPLFPAADEKVLAVTATDADDKLFENANVGRYVALAAPGVDVLLPVPDGNYELETGTSVSAALVSGVAALVLQLHPSLPPADLRKLLAATAKPLGAGGQDNEFGAGLVDAFRALSADGVQKGSAPAPAATQ